MPDGRPCCERDEAREHQQQDAPEQVMDVQPALGDQVSKGPVRKQLEMDDRRDHAQDHERKKKGGQRAERDPPAEVEVRRYA